MEEGITPPEPPPQIKVCDLSGSTIGKAVPKNAPAFVSGQHTDMRSPAALMRQMGFSPTSSMTPLQFLVAVYNDDYDKIFRSEKRKNKVIAAGGISMAYRLEAAKTAVKYLHMEMPKVTIDEKGGEYGENLRKAAEMGNERLRTRTMIVETVERISPDLPLEDASYPASYQITSSRPMDESGVIEGEVLNPDGDRDYNPDAD